MFDIISRLRPIVLDAYTPNSTIYEQFPIVPANQSYPDWWKQMPGIITSDGQKSWGILKPVATIKRCDGLIDLYKKAINIPLWSDIIIKIENNNLSFVCAAESDTGLTFHERNQFNSPEFENSIHAKLMVPWAFREKTGVQFELCHPVWNNIENMHNFTVPSGLLNYRDQNGAHCNMFIPARDNVINLTAGTPIMQIIPITERPVKIVNHLVSRQEMQQILELGSFSTDWYGRYKKAVKRRANSPTYK